MVLDEIRIRNRNVSNERLRRASGPHASLMLQTSFSDAIQNPIFLRGMERLLVVGGAIVLSYLGYRLFVFGVREGESRLSAESPFYKIVLSGTGPGLFFMAFGALVLISALYTGGAERGDRAPTEETQQTERASDLADAGISVEDDGLVFRFEIIQ